MDKMDPRGYTMYRLYKDHMRYENGELIKVPKDPIAFKQKRLQANYIALSISKEQSRRRIDDGTFKRYHLLAYDTSSRERIDK